MATIVSQATQLAARPGAAAPTPAEAKLPKPDPFDEDRNKLRPFLRQLRVNCSTIVREQPRLRYVFALLRGLALNQILSYVNEDEIRLSGLRDLIAVLKAAFGDSHRQRNAERKLVALRMGIRDFASFYAKFQRYAAKAG
jgi:hypothetical protein